MLNLPANPKQHLIIFTRDPEAAKTKIRLIPALGTIGAANLQREITEYTIDLLQKSQMRGTSKLELGSIDDLRTSKKLK
ncbi:MAG: hypothetical protein V7L29_28110, partial [Nostoc sp.]